MQGSRLWRSGEEDSHCMDSKFSARIVESFMSVFIPKLGNSSQHKMKNGRKNRRRGNKGRKNREDETVDENEQKSQEVRIDSGLE